MKNFLKVSVFLSLLLAFACTQDNDVTPTGDVAISEIQLALEEVVLQGTGAGGNGSDSTCRGPRGKFEHGQRGKGKHDHPNRGEADSITVAQLPTAAQTYLTTNNLTANVKSVFKITHKDSTGATVTTYIVRFTDKTHIHFDKDGNVVNKPTRNFTLASIALTDLPAAAQTYLAANTDVSKITHIVKITKPDGTIEYGVRSGDNKHWHFDAAGALKKRKK
jgi:hypothetical protein